MIHLSTGRRRAVAVCAVFALLFSQWAGAVHPCPTGEAAGSGQTPVQIAPHDCVGAHGASGRARTAGAAPVCALHCAQPDGASAAVKVSVPDAIVAHEHFVRALPAGRVRVAHVRASARGPTPEARRRLIEQGALLI